MAALVRLEQAAARHAVSRYGQSGGGSWWSDANRAMLKSVRALIDEEHVMMTESCCEYYADCFAFNIIRNTLWGAIPSVDGFAQAELDAEGSGSRMCALKTAVDFYRANRELFLYGRLVTMLDCEANEVEVEWPIARAGVCPAKTPAVLAALWEAPDGGQAILMGNVSVETQTATVNGRTVTIAARDIVKLT